MDIDIEFTDPLALLAEQINIQTGFQSWSFARASDFNSRSASSFPLNFVGFQLQKNIYRQINYGVGAQVGTGKTQDQGGYTLYNGSLEFSWKQRLSGYENIINTWEIGAMAQASGLSVTDDTYGGNDIISGGFFVRTSGMLEPKSNAKWFSQFDIVPLNLGRIGYGNQRQTIRSAFGWGLKVGGLGQAKLDEIQWGGSLNYQQNTILDSSSNEITLGKSSVQLLARYAY